MRVNPTSRALHRLHRDDSGAVLMVVAVTLLVLIGMLVLTVDLGRGVAIKREMVSGTDAAVLAAAHECAIGHTYDQANAAANAILAQNKSGAVQNGVLSAPGCGLKPTEPRFVSINTKVQMDYFFAGIFGFNSGEVGANAVAEWGVVASGLGAPITVDHEQLANCSIPTDNPPTTQISCQLEYPKDQLTNPRWGALDLSRWGDANAAPCHVSASDLIGIIENGGAFEPLPTPNYDCLDNGLSDSVWSSLVGKTLLFPVNDLDRSTGTTKPGNADCTGADIPALQAQGKDCQIDTAYIVGWIQLRVDGMSKHGPDISLDVTYLGLSSGGGIPGPGTEDWGARAVRLVT
jgi:Putative Flp pilus-assembly TadE/G-like